MIVSPFHNFSVGTQFAPNYNAVTGPPYSHHQHYHGGGGDGGQLQSVYNAVAAAAATVHRRQGVYDDGDTGQHPVPLPYRPGEYGANQPPSPYMTPSRYHEQPRPSTTTESLPPPPPNRRKPLPVQPQQPSVQQYTRVQGGVPGGTALLLLLISYTELGRTLCAKM